MVKNLNTISEVDFLQRRTIIVRYEDIAVSPEKFTQALYDQLEIGKFLMQKQTSQTFTDLTEDIQQWLKTNTHDTSRRINMYSTSRDSAKVASDWRNPRSNRSCFQQTSLHDFVVDRISHVDPKFRKTDYVDYQASLKNLGKTLEFRVCKSSSGEMRLNDESVRLWTTGNSCQKLQPLDAKHQALRSI